MTQTNASTSTEVQNRSAAAEPAAPPAAAPQENATAGPAAKEPPGDALAAATRGVPLASDPPSLDVNPRAWSLRRGDQLVLAGLAAICLFFIAWYQLKLSGWGRQPIEIHHLPQHEVQYRIDINTAGWVELAQLPRIGRNLAERIVEDRQRRGPFSSLDELSRVKGIGPKTIEHIRRYLKQPTAQQPTVLQERDDIGESKHGNPRP